VVHVDVWPQNVTVKDRGRGEIRMCCAWLHDMSVQHGGGVQED